MTLPPFTWLRIAALAVSVYIVYGSFRMVLVYKGLVRSPFTDSGSPTLIAISFQRGWVFLLSLVPLVVAPWPALVTYLVGIRGLGAVVSLIQCIRGVPPFERTLGDEAHRWDVPWRVVILAVYVGLTFASARFLGT